MRCCLWAWLLLMLPTVAAASPTAEDRVIVIAGVGADVDESPAARRVRAELGVTGFGVRDTSAPDAMTSRAWATERLESDETLAAILMRIDGDGTLVIEWWQRDRERGVSRRWITPLGQATDTAEVLAIRTAELAFAALELENMAQPEPPEEPAAAPVQPPVPAPDRSPLALWRVQLGFGPLWSPGGLGVMLQPTLGASLALGPKRRFGIAADGSGTALRGRVDLDGTRRNVGIALARTYAVWWIRPDRRVSPSLAVGGGLAIGWVAPTPREQTVVGVVCAAPALSINVSSHVAVAAGLRAAIAVPRFEVASETNLLATAGTPLLEGWLGLEIQG